MQQISLQTDVGEESRGREGGQPSARIHHEGEGRGLPGTRLHYREVERRCHILIIEGINNDKDETEEEIMVPQEE